MVLKKSTRADEERQRHLAMLVRSLTDVRAELNQQREMAIEVRQTINER